MHRSIEIGVESARATALVHRLRRIDGIVGLSHLPGASVVPAGDVVTVHVLNRAADAVMKVAADSGTVSVVTAEVASISDTKHQKAIDGDIDEAIWEEVETGMRHQGRIGTNYLLLMALGGAIGAAGALARPDVAAAAYVASAIIAPGFEPISKLPLGLVLGRREVFTAGLYSTIAGYGILVLAAAATYLMLAAFSGADAQSFLDGEALKNTLHPDATVLTIAAAGAVAGVVIQAAYRRSVIAGALVALRLIEIAAVIGIAVAIGRFDLVWQGLLRLSVDIGFVVAAGLVVFGLKQWLVHRRAPLH